MFKVILRFVIYVSISFFSSSSVLAVNYYVDKDKSNASDSNSGTSEANPFKTINKALQSGMAGDTVLVKSGTYLIRRDNSDRFTGALRANPGTSDTNRVIVKVYPGNSVTLSYDPAETNKGPIIACNNFNTWDGFKIVEVEANYAADTGPVVVAGVTGCNLFNLEIKGDYVCRQAASDSCDTKKCPSGCGNVKDNHSGIRSERATNLLIRNTKIYGFYESGSAGGIKDYGGNGILIENCEFYNNHYGVNFKDTTKNGSLRFSYLHDISTGISMTGNGNVIGPINIYQNIFLNISGNAISVGYNPSTLVVNAFNNTMYNTSQNATVNFWRHTQNTQNNAWNNLIYNVKNIVQEWYPPISITYWNKNGYYFPGSSVAVRNQSLSGACGSFGMDCDSYEADQLFVNAPAGDYHLQASSPFRSTGKYPGIDRQDYNGNGNTTEAISMGAYITGTEVIGTGGTNYSPPQQLTPKPPSNLLIQ